MSAHSNPHEIAATTWRSLLMREEVPVDAQRYEGLLRKRDEVGLSDDEANELGRMMAEREGKPYGRTPGVTRIREAPNGDGTDPDAERGDISAEESARDEEMRLRGGQRSA